LSYTLIFKELTEVGLAVEVVALCFKTLKWLGVTYGQLGARRRQHIASARRQALHSSAKRSGPEGRILSSVGRSGLRGEHWNYVCACVLDRPCWWAGVKRRRGG
jgi:hypothetical protein